MSKKHPNEGNMHFVYGVRVSNSKKTKKRRSRYQCTYYSYKGICSKKICRCLGVSTCKDYEAKSK